MNDAVRIDISRPSLYLGGLGLLLLAILSVTPLVFEVWRVKEDRQVESIKPHPSAILDWGSKAVVVLAMALAVALRAWADRRDEPWAGSVTLLLVAVAGAMTAWHWFAVDVWFYDPNHAWYQPQHYLDVLNNAIPAPHPYRPLPYGFIRSLEHLTGDWTFSRLAYRWFFTFWFLWAAYRFARLFHEPVRALAATLAIPVLFPLSILYYAGQPTDPVSHALFALALVYTVQDRWLLLAAALAIGVMAKETVVLMVPAYVACYARQGWPAFLKTGVLGAACVAAFLAVRLPLDWRPGYGDLNGTEGLMVASNLGFDLGFSQRLHDPAGPLYLNYLLPFVFVGLFMPFIAWHWQRLDGRLRAIFLTLTPLLLLSNLCFGWMYEARNYMPLVPLLATMALPVGVAVPALGTPLRQIKPS